MNELPPPITNSDFDTVVILTPAEAMELSDIIWHVNQVVGNEQVFPLLDRAREILARASE